MKPVTTIAITRVHINCACAIVAFNTAELIHNLIEQRDWEQAAQASRTSQRFKDVEQKLVLRLETIEQKEERLARQRGNMPENFEPWAESYWEP